MKLPSPYKPARRVVQGELIPFDEIPFGNGPIFPSDQRPPWPDINPMWRSRQLSLREAVTVTGKP